MNISSSYATMYLLIYWWLEFSNRLSQNVAVCQMFVQNAEDLMVQGFVHTNTLNKLLDGLQGRKGGREREKERRGEGELCDSHPLVPI